MRKVTQRERELEAQVRVLEARIATLETQLQAAIGSGVERALESQTTNEVAPGCALCGKPVVRSSDKVCGTCMKKGRKA